MSREDQLHHDNEKGEYREEVDGIAANLLERYFDGDITSQRDLMREVEETAAESSYTNDDTLCVLVLMYSDFPTAYLAEHGRNAGIDHDFEIYRRTGLDSCSRAQRYKTQRPWDGGRREFPWREFALEAMTADVWQAINDDKEFQARASQPEPEEESEEENEADHGQEEDAGSE